MTKTKYEYYFDEEVVLAMPLEALVKFDTALIYKNLLNLSERRFRVILKKCEDNPYRLEKYLKNMLDLRLGNMENAAKTAQSPVNHVIPEKPKAVEISKPNL